MRAQEQYILQGLVKRGLPPHVAQAFVMNFKDESGLNPGINEHKPLVPGSRGGFGLYQLTGPRRVAYEKFAAQRGVDPSDTDAQLDWLMVEGQGPEKKAFDAILAAPDTGTAASAITTKFLRPSPEHQRSRVAKYMNAAPGKVGGDSMVARNHDPQVAAQTNTPTFGSMSPFGGGGGGMQPPPGIDPAVANYAFAEEPKPLGERMQEAGKHFSAAMQTTAPRPSPFPGGPSAEQAGGLLKALKNPQALAQLLMQKRMG